MKRALCLLVMLTGCATPVHAPQCPVAAGPNVSVSMCTAQPVCKHHCNVTVSGATSTGAGDQTITTHSQPTVEETRNSTKSMGPLP